MPLACSPRLFAAVRVIARAVEARRIRLRAAMRGVNLPMMVLDARGVLHLRIPSARDRTSEEREGESALSFEEAWAGFYRSSGVALLGRSEMAQKRRGRRHPRSGNDLTVTGLALYTAGGNAGLSAPLTETKDT